MPHLTDEEAAVLSGIDPSFQWAPLEHRRRCLAEGIPFVLESGRRSQQFQALLFNHPELHPGSPAAAPGTSNHELGFAYDATGARTAAQAARYGAIAEELGLEWGGRYTPRPDPNHVESPLPRAVLLDYIRVRYGMVRV